MSGYGITTCAPQMALLDSNKGSFGNRVDCAVDHAKNNVKTGAKVAAVATGFAGASAYNFNPLGVAVTSPRLVGEAAYALGKGASKLPQKDITPYLVQMLTGE